MSQNVSGATGYQGTGANSAINKKAKITHLFTLLAVGVAVLYAIIASLLHFYVLSLFCVGIVVAFGSCNLLNRYGYLDMARICLILSADAFVFYISGSLGEASSLRPLYFPLVCSIFMLFDLKDVNKIVALGAVSLGCLAIGEYTHYALFLIPFISQNTSQIISSSTFFASIATSIACIFYLVSVNTQSEKYLDRERLNNKSIIDNTDDIILLVNRKYEVEVMNIALERSFKRMFGDKFGIGSNVVDMINAIDGIPPQFKQWKSHYDRAFTGEKFSFEEKGQAPTGDFRYLETVFNPVLRGGEVTGVAIFIHDITARKNLEESIKRLNAGQKAIIDGGNYSIISVGLDGLVTSFNKGSEVILGYRADEIIGKFGPHDLIAKKQLMLVARQLTETLGTPVAPDFDIVKAIAESGIRENEWYVTTKSGQSIVLSSSITSLRNEAGDIFGYLIISTDNTEKKNAEAQLQKAAEEDRRRVWVNTGIADMGQLLRMRAESRSIFYGNVVQFVAGYIDARQANLYKVAEDEKGNHYLSHVAGYATDFQKTKKVLQFGESLVGQVAMELKTSLLKDVPTDYIKINSSLGEASPASIAIMPILFQDKLMGVIELASLKEFSPVEMEFMERANTVFGASIDLMDRQDHTQMLLRDSLELNEKLKTQEEELRVGNEELTEKGNLLQASEEELRVQQEELIHINESMEEKATLLEEQNEAILAKNAELESAREALKLKAEELEVTGRYKSEFLANMSHELRTPLNSILILSKLLAEGNEGNLNAKQVEFAHVIQKSGTDLLNLINDILDLSKIESRKIDLEIEDVPFSGVSYSMNSLFVELAKEKEVQFEVSIAHGLGETFKGDQVRTEQILKNLLSNAFKFTPKQGKVSLNIFKADPKEVYKNPHLSKSAHNICFEVKDSGIGISGEKQELIFEAFRQADGSTSRKYGGTGLGLSISKELALILGGELRLVSKSGEGSAFTLILPSVFDPDSARSNDVSGNFDPTPIVPPNPAVLAPSDTKMLESLAPSGSQGAAKRAKKLVLIIEDDVQFAKLLKNQAEEKGFDAVVTERGEQGLEKIQELLPDAVLLDIGLPGMDGWEVMRKMKENPKTSLIPVHIMSGNDNQHLGTELGAADFLLKPVSLQHLNAVFDKIQANEELIKQKILIVEDSQIQSIIVKKMLSNKGLDCIVADNGEKALEMIALHRPGIVITDLNLPDMNGADLVKQIKSNPDTSDINIIIYTGKDLGQKENEELSRYSDAIIIKSAKSQERLLDETTLFLKKVGKGKFPTHSVSTSAASFVGGASLKGKKILLVDDDMRNIFAISKVLENEELHVIVANDGKEALQKLESQPDVDMVLMDIMMPEMDGYEAMKAIRGQREHEKLPIIALTAKAMKGDRDKCMDAGASDYISKPIDINKLMSLVRVWLS